MEGKLYITKSLNYLLVYNNYKSMTIILYQLLILSYI